MRRKGLFIIIDGPSASGKDSVTRQLLKDLRNLNIQVFSIQETREKDYDRKKILTAKSFGDKKTAEAIISERRKIYQTKIIPQLSDGKLVIANRGEPTTLTYQVIGEEMVMEDIWKMHRKANIPLPDLVIILNCSVEEALLRERLREQSLEKENKKLMNGKFTSDRQQIHTNYERAKNFLEAKGLSVLYLENDNISVRKQGRMVAEKIKEKLNICE